MALSWSGFSDVAKELYPDGIDEELCMKSHPLLSMVQHRTDFYHRYLHIPIRYKLAGVGASHTAAKSVTNESAGSYDAFQVTRINDYAFWRIAGEVVDAAKAGNDAVFIDSLKSEMDGCLENMGNKLGKEIYRGTSGSRAQVGSGTSSPITLKNIEDIYYFEVGQVITANDTDDTTSPRSGTGTITAINEDTGVITYSGTITSLAVDDYLFVEGDEGAAAAGLSAWCPSSAPGATAFYGVDRSSNTTRLGGIRFDASAYAMEEVLIRARARAARSAHKPDYYFCNPTDLADFEVAKEGSKQLVSAREYSFGIESVRAYGVDLVSDPDCPPGVMYALDMSAFGWASMGECPRLFNGDGLDFIRTGAGVDQYEGQMVARHNFYSDAPGKIMRIALPA